jgi:TRAP transporter TAXI family solute receptor
LELVQNKPKEYIGLAPTSTTLHARPGEAWSKARKPYDGGRFVANIMSMTQLLVTFDPSIKSPEALKGKTIHVGRKGAGNTPDHLAILKAMGILKDVKLLYGGFGDGAAKLRDGFCDATFMIINDTYPHTFAKGRYIEELETRKPISYIGFKRAMLLKLRNSGHATVPVHIPAKALDPKMQPNPLWAFNDPIYIMADASMDPRIVEEVTRVIYETPASEWAKWNPQGEGMTNECKIASPVPDIIPPHPGAQAFYAKKGIKMGDLADLLK